MHFAPLLRMQGFFNEVALYLVKKDGEPFPALVNAAEPKGADGIPLFIRLTVLTRRTGGSTNASPGG
jgi:sigma-B regulation protein RsbU (phosphoserine phosphatase)